MHVSETMTFDDYWADPRFLEKRPDLTGSTMQAYGDNIYSRDENGQWRQLDSHHSRPGGEINPDNVTNDTQTNRVLVATEFSYFGEDAPLMPAALRGEGSRTSAHTEGTGHNSPPASLRRSWAG